MVKIAQATLYDLYITHEKNPYEIATIVGCNHKTIRSYLTRYGIPKRTASEYNYLPRISHKRRLSEEDLMSSLSVAGHIAYLCEGGHTEKYTSLQFTNQDPNLIDLVVRMLKEVYLVANPRIKIAANEGADTTHFQHLYPEAKLDLDRSRKNPILRVTAGGRSLVRDVVQNAYLLLDRVKQG